MNIFLLEDSMMVAECLCELLHDEGHTVTHCVTVADALAWYDRGGVDAWDVMLIDYELPDGTGLDFLSKLRGSDKAMTIMFSKAGMTVDHHISNAQLVELREVIRDVDAQSE